MGRGSLSCITVELKLTIDLDLVVNKFLRVWKTPHRIKRYSQNCKVKEQKQAEAEVVPSSSLVEVEVGIDHKPDNQ